jgi:diguanylate cyclase (GGDEF)-like protein
LTGLANRRSVDDAVHRALEELDKHGVHDVCIVLADANGLKAVNDTLGHAEGDRFLRLLARTLVQQFAKLPGSLVARVGGDEFCVVVVGHPPEVVRSVASTAVRATYRLDVGHGIACGVASAGGPDQGRQLTTTELFQAADRAQYAAKRLGARYAVPADPATTRSA